MGRGERVHWERVLPNRLHYDIVVYWIRVAAPHKDIRIYFIAQRYEMLGHAHTRKGDRNVRLACESSSSPSGSRRNSEKLEI